MRIQPFGVGSFVHVVKRGARGLPITRDEKDRERFVRLLYYLNDEHQSEFWELDVRHIKDLQWPKQWPEHRPLVKVIAWTLMPNHFHLLLQEIQDAGVSRFMQRLCGSMSRHFNEKYEETGSIFQGSYRSRTIDTDRYLRWALSYVLVKNVFELYPGGYDRAVRKFDSAWKWGVEKYAFSGLREVTYPKKPSITDIDLFYDFFKSSADFKSCSRDMILSRRGEAVEAVSFE